MAEVWVFTQLEWHKRHEATMAQPTAAQQQSSGEMMLVFYINAARHGHIS